VVFWDSKTKKREELVKEEKVPAELNLKEEAEEFARCIEERDTKAIERYEGLSREILRVLERSRRQNGLLFPGGI
jgi:hypothetical protein